MAGRSSDQYSTGWAIRHWGAEQWRRTGHIPLWDPERLSGVVVAAGFGDLFYPSAWLRLFMPTTIAIDLAFVVHYVLAGFFLYLLLRMLDTSWLGAVVGGTAYQLSGVVVSYASPGHDGKLFVTALFPLMLIGLCWEFDAADSRDTRCSASLSASRCCRRNTRRRNTRCSPRESSPSI